MVLRAIAWRASSVNSSSTLSMLSSSLYCLTRLLRGSLSTRTSASSSRSSSKVEPHDLVKFGLIPELIGRLPVITVLDDLDEDALVRGSLRDRKSTRLNSSH